MKVILCGLMGLLFSAGSTAATVVYIDVTHPLVRPDVTVIELDAALRMQQQLFGSLSADPQQAEQQARRITGSSSFKRSQPLLAKAWSDVAHAWAIGLRKYPAVVFDDTWVVYGTTDVDVARQQLAAWQVRHP
ncbi:MAG TPA: TIGR03757 family integrating conjugative element protein [Scandinavium sp.]